jgi:hypothetical protein
MRGPATNFGYRQCSSWESSRSGTTADIFHDPRLRAVGWRDLVPVTFLEILQEPLLPAGWLAASCAACTERSAAPTGGDDPHGCDDGRWRSVGVVRLASGDWGSPVVRHNLPRAVLSASLLERNGLLPSPQRVCAPDEGSLLGWCGPHSTCRPLARGQERPRVLTL